MEKYSKLWTQFETQALAYGLLRKALYPAYLVRGYNGSIGIYKPNLDTYNPTKALTIQVSASESKNQCGFFQKGPQEWLLVGGDDAWNIVNLVKKAVGEGA